MYVIARSQLADYQNKSVTNIGNPVFMDDPGIAHNSHNHTTGGYVLFWAGFFLARRPQNFDQIWLFCSKFTRFLAYFLQALIMRRCTNIDKYEVWNEKILCKLMIEYLLILYYSSIKYFNWSCSRRRQARNRRDDLRLLNSLIKKEVHRSCGADTQEEF